MYLRLIIAFAICLCIALAFGIIANITLFEYYHIQPGNPRALAILPLLALLTITGLVLRFWRWHYFLRQSHIRIPTRISLGIYLSGFSQTIIPLFVGEIALKSILVKRHSDTPLQRTILIVAYERFLDFITLAFLTIPYAIITRIDTYPLWTIIPIVILILMLIPPLRKLAWKAVSSVLNHFIRLLLPQYKTTALRTPVSITSTRVTITALILSLASWLAVASILPLSTAMLDNNTSWIENASIYAVSTIAGGITLSPGGVGITGSTMAESLIGRGMNPSHAGLAAMLTRASTFVLVFALGTVSFLAYLWWNRKSKSRTSFDQFQDYESEFAVASRDYYVRKKVNRMTHCLAQLFPNNDSPPLGLDLGCGPGWHLSAMSDSGFQIIGIDSNTQQITIARKNSPSALLQTADIRYLPYKHRQFDFAYCINILHHLPTEPSQKLALSEIHRILKPGGILFLHEMNPSNTPFRFYLEYILPLFNPIDCGTEIWITPESLKHTPVFDLKTIDYFTFLPDFLPKWFLQTLNPLEKSLERSSLSRFGFHYMATLQKPPLNDPQ